MNNEWIKKHQIIWFVLISYLLASIVTIIHNVFHISFFSFDNVTAANVILWLVYAFSPTISVFLVVSLAEGKEGVLKILRGYVRWKVHWVWYFAALILLLAPLVVGIVFFLAGASPGSSVSLTVGNVFAFIGFGLLSGPISEEAGWRGLMLPKLESKYNALVSGLILGPIWFVWHIPLFFIEGSSQYASLQYGVVSAVISISIYFVLVMVITQILTFLYNNTKGSLIITILAHFCFNFSSTLVQDSMLGLLTINTFNIVGSVLAVVYLAFIFIFYGYKKMSRKDAEDLPFQKIANSES
ncbi:MAG: CPBP family intramembrane metalloprotease [Candidatus Heimdallarchaeota archaeon]|nr:CPBP family intramembrane metalloprotease [Candidatus Heimdallarchaeota archaeon]